MLDKLPAPLRHVAIAVMGALLTFLIGQISSGVAPHDFNLDTAKGAFDAVVGAGLTALLLAVTPLTKQYGFGVGTETPADEPTDGQSMQG